jgi:hypothetical protein
MGATVSCGFAGGVGYGFMKVVDEAIARDSPQRSREALNRLK